MAIRTGAQIIWESLIREEVCKRSSATPVAPSCPPTTRCSTTRSATSWSDTSRAPRTWPTAMRAPAAASASHGHVRPRRDQPGHRHRDGDDGLDADGLHHRPGPELADRPRRVPGDRHHRHHAADHQAQLPGDARRGHRAGDPRGVPARAGRAAQARCSSTSRRTRSRRSTRLRLPGASGVEAAACRSPRRRRLLEAASCSRRRSARSSSPVTAC